MSKESPSYITVQEKCYMCNGTGKRKTDGVFEICWLCKGEGMKGVLKEDTVDCGACKGIGEKWNKHGWYEDCSICNKKGKVPRSK